ncbi:hypothetical protein [Kistimonas asteriae]|uniref:hypothetical protein n=1 Tax=Kistimonas asteriae TaxID=517724 RepID=UPI001BAC2AE7|nr:hypothetical protein [Kistimonas asteriae]
MKSQSAVHAIWFLLLSMYAAVLHAALAPIQDDELSDITGQAFIKMETDQIGSTEYTRVNLGVSVATQTNIDKLTLGQYDRAGEVAGSADIDIDHFSLGTVDDNGNVVPFYIKDPYLEFAYEGDKMVGFRIGFNEAKGDLGGTINTLTGNVPVLIEGTAEPILDKANGWQKFLLGIAGVTDSTVLRANAQLVTESGEADPVRATHVGMENGQTLDHVSGGGGGWTDALLGLFGSDDCEVTGLATCFALSDYKALYIGQENVANPTASELPDLASIDGAAKGMFISVQFEDGVAWRDLEDPAKTINTVLGAFMNIPETDGTPSIVVDFNEAFNGTASKDTCAGSAMVGC